MAILSNGVKANGQAEVVDGNLQVTQEHTPYQFVPVVFVATNFSSTAAEGLLTLQAYRSGAASGAAATSFSPTTGKKLKLLHMSLQVRNAAAVQQNCSCFLRYNPNGVVVVGTPAWLDTVAFTPPGAAAGISGTDSRTLEDHVIFSGTDQFGVTQFGSVNAGNYFMIRGYEYTEI